MTKKILLTGFEPFGGETINPSWEIVKQLDNAIINAHQIIAKQLSCVFGLADKQLLKSIDELNPDLVICLGQAGGRADISLEKVAINFIDARIADNAGNQIINEPVNSKGNAAYFSNLPLATIRHKVNNQNIPCSISYTAGTFVCNYIFYKLMEHVYSHYPNTKAGFVHIPFLCQQAINKSQQPSMSMETMITGISLIIQAATSEINELKITSGTLH